MEDDETPGTKRTVSDEEYQKNGLSKVDMNSITQHIRVLSMQM